MMRLLHFGCHLAATWVETFLEAFAPLDEPVMPMEPVLTDNEIGGVRQLLEERFPTQFLHHT